MIIPSNLYLTNQERVRYEKFIQNNHKKIKGVFLLLNTRPFGKNIDELKEYYLFMGEITKRYNIPPIGIFNETVVTKFSDTLSQDVIDFQIDLERFIKSGITIIVRPYSWYRFDLYRYKIRFFIPSESITDLLKRVIDTDLFWSHLEYLENGIEQRVATIPFEKSSYHKRLSLAHPDFTFDGKLFYQAILKTSPKLLDEIDDIYFGREFIYDDGIKYLKYGNVMGANATDEQVDYLFKIQEELGISISLTLNSMTSPPELIYDPNVQKAFLGFLKHYYDRGLRVVTISDVHLIKTGILHKNFPLMKFKNTVNHKVVDTQTFINYANLGYDYIQLDRSLNRNMSELKKIAKANKKYGKKLYLLASEYCMYNCPFKHEHDTINQEVLSASGYFGGITKLSHLSCDNWRFGAYGIMPRNGVDLIPKDQEALDEYLAYVDVLKFSGRMVDLDRYKGMVDFAFYFEGEDSLEEKAKKGFKGRLRIINSKVENQKIDERYNTKEGEQLLDVLKNCKNECYECHLCEKVFGVEPFDSLVELQGERY